MLFFEERAPDPAVVAAEKVREMARAARILGQPLREFVGSVTATERREIEAVLGPGALDAEPRPT
jgi:hypothetical protein